MADYISGGDAAFNACPDKFATYAGANLANLSLVRGDIDPIVTAQGTWSTALGPLNSAERHGVEPARGQA